MRTVETSALTRRKERGGLIREGKRRRTEDCREVLSEELFQENWAETLPTTKAKCIYICNKIALIVIICSSSGGGGGGGVDGGGGGGGGGLRTHREFCD